jgi:hypothetical protein
VTCVAAGFQLFASEQLLCFFLIIRGAGVIVWDESDTAPCHSLIMRFSCLPEALESLIGTGAFPEALELLIGGAIIPLHCSYCCFLSQLVVGLRSSLFLRH